MRVCLSVWPQTHKGPHQADITLPCLAPPRPAVDPLSVGVILFIALFSSSWFLLGIDASCVCREASPPCPAPPQCYLTTRQLCTGWTPTAVTPLPPVGHIVLSGPSVGFHSPYPPSHGMQGTTGLSKLLAPSPHPSSTFSWSSDFSFHQIYLYFYMS